MKYSVSTLILLSGLSIFSVSSYAQHETLPVSTPKIQGAEITFEKEVHDYGTIEYDSNGDCFFHFTNTGSAPLTISNAVGSCGCTVPEYPRDPIAPGQTGELLVKFNGTGKNQVTKQVTITANTAAGKEILRIKAFVESKADGSVVSPWNSK